MLKKKTTRFTVAHAFMIALSLSLGAGDAASAQSSTITNESRDQLVNDGFDGEQDPIVADLIAGRVPRESASSAGPSAGRLRSSTGPMPFEPTTTPKQNGAAIGRYLYLGPVPRFAPGDLELYVSKLGLTMRVKAWVPSAMPGNYGLMLLSKWSHIANAFNRDSMSFVRMKSADQISAAAQQPATQAWIAVARQYMDHVLDPTGLDIYSRTLPAAEYKRTILLATLRYYLDSNSITEEQANALYSQLSTDPTALEAYRPISEALWERHMGPNFTEDASRGPGYAGYLTLVYPIAVHADGPFAVPGEAARRVGNPGSMESRWWSDKWQDAYGGFPFLLINDYGVAHHGPVTFKSAPYIEYLQREFVSHGCFRMDPSDVMELRAMLPVEYSRLLNQGRGILHVTTEGPDVTDWDRDGTLEALDVAYYSLPQTITPAQVPGLTGARAQASYRARHYTAYDGKLTSTNRYDPNEARWYGIPKYSLNPNGTLKRSGVHNGVQVYTFPFRGGRIVQYREQGIRLQGHDDNAGRFPPKYFLYP